MQDEDPAAMARTLASLLTCPEKRVNSDPETDGSPWTTSVASTIRKPATRHQIFFLRSLARALPTRTGGMATSPVQFAERRSMRRCVPESISPLVLRGVDSRDGSDLAKFKLAAPARSVNSKNRL